MLFYYFAFFLFSLLGNNIFARVAIQTETLQDSPIAQLHTLKDAAMPAMHKPTQYLPHLVVPNIEKMCKRVYDIAYNLFFPRVCYAHIGVILLWLIPTAWFGDHMLAYFTIFASLGTFVLYLEQLHYPPYFEEKTIRTFIVRVVATLHAICIAGGAFYCFWSPEATSLFKKIGVFTRVYACWDALSVMYYAKETWRDICLMWLHHALIVFGMTKGIEWNSKRTSQLFISEITQPFLYLSWYLIKIQKQQSVLFKVSSLVSFTTYFMLRFLNYIAVVYQIVKEKAIYEFVLFMPIFLMNVYWMYLLTKKLVEVLSNKKLKKEDELS